MIGKIASHREIAARWSYSEITGRFASEYQKRHQEHESKILISKIICGRTFEELNESEKNCLSDWFEHGFRRDYANTFNSWYKSFKCESWTKSQLARVRTLPILDPIRQWRSLDFLSYLAHPRSRLENGELNVSDPAVAADAVPVGTVFQQREPLIIGHWNDGSLVLWEGNFRAVLFARTPDPLAEVLVWMPYEGNWPPKPF